MAEISAQVSLYPLRQPSIGPIIREAVRTFWEQGLQVQMGPMSTLVWGDEERVFAALRKAFGRAAGQGEVVMVVTLSNACPRPAEAG